ncbi:hypothetical protein, partial [Candidatus Deferrimicrobium sp.]|uniref:hypothetical protein n=1 Tax=Candidatus Deferrimicrobium sp. TaxID=3060586 RepID=UPI002ED9D22F
PIGSALSWPGGISSYRIELIARENTWPNPIITISSNNQTFGVILVFTDHLLIGFVCRQTDMYTVYNKEGQKASCLPVPVMPIIITYLGVLPRVRPGADADHDVPSGTPTDGVRGDRGIMDIRRK